VETKNASFELFAELLKPCSFSTHARSATDEGYARYLPGFLESNRFVWKHI
jgi:hypothetical protein